MHTKLTIVLVEDDHEQEADFSQEIKLAFKDVDIIRISCEAEFLDQYENRRDNLPDIFVIDLMLEWRQPWVKSTRPLPEPVPDQDEAGLRCLKAIRRYSAEVPVVIWTMTNKELPPGWVDNRTTFYFRKDLAVEGELFELIRKAVRVH